MSDPENVPSSDVSTESRSSEISPASDSNEVSSSSQQPVATAVPETAHTADQR
jgi:hypothetical protein